MIQFEKLLTLSTAHICKETADKLDADPETNCLGLCVYNKAQYGWFIADIQHAPNVKGFDELPEDLHNLILFAKDLGVDILCLDCDGDELPYLETYTW